MADEYIRKQDASDWLKQYGQDVLHGKYKFSLMYIWKNLMDLPSADVAPVVRCENCVHWSDSNQCERPELAGNRWHDDKYFETLPDDFCSYGERKEE